MSQAPKKEPELPQSSKEKSEQLAFSDHGEEDLWENLERVKGGKASYSDSESSSTSQAEPEKGNDDDKGMTIAQFLGQDDGESQQKQSSLSRKEIQGTKEERFLQINNYS